MTSKDPRKKLRVPDEIAALIRGCHPHLKRKIRAGLRHIVVEPEAGKPLRDELEGLKSYRISRFRIVYRISSKRIIDIVAVGPRRTIYEETYKIIKTFLIALLCASLAMSMMQSASACSRAVYFGQEGQTVSGRSMDWLEDMQTNLWIFPRGMTRDGGMGAGDPNG